jgi:hypothetical protein
MKECVDDIQNDRSSCPFTQRSPPVQESIFNEGSYTFQPDKADRRTSEVPPCSFGN